MDDPGSTPVRVVRHALLVGVFFLLFGSSLTALHDSGALFRWLAPSLAHLEDLAPAAGVMRHRELNHEGVAVIGDASFLDRAGGDGRVECRVARLDVVDIAACLEILSAVGYRGPVVAPLRPYFLSDLAPRGPMPATWMLPDEVGGAFSRRKIGRVFRLLALWLKTPPRGALKPLSDEIEMSPAVSFVAQPPSMAALAEAVAIWPGSFSWVVEPEANWSGDAPRFVAQLGRVEANFGETVNLGELGQLAGGRWY